MDDPLIRVSEVARKIGLNRSTLTRQVKAGLIRSHSGLVRLSEVLEDRAANIDARIAEAETAAVMPGSDATNHATKSDDATNGETVAEAERELAKALVDGQAMPLGKAKALKETYLARLRQLEFQIKSGKLVDAETARRVTFSLARQTRDAWQNWPARVSPVMASELGVDQVKLGVLLDAAVRDQLQQIADAV